jgi:hypothetical protein
MQWLLHVARWVPVAGWAAAETLRGLMACSPLQNLCERASHCSRLGRKRAICAAFYCFGLSRVVFATNRA